MNPRSIFDGLRVVHPKHGRGEVKRSWPDRLVAWCQFDDGGGSPALVRVDHLVEEPRDMPVVAKPDLRLVPVPA